MAHSDATEDLSSLVKQVISVSDRVLKPLLGAGSLETVNMDHDKMMRGLTPQEGLTQFHPFGETHLPMPSTQPKPTNNELNSAVEDTPGESSRGIRPSLSSAVTPSKAHSESLVTQQHRNVTNNQTSVIQNTHNHWLLNESFTELVEQVSDSLNTHQVADGHKESGLNPGKLEQNLNSGAKSDARTHSDDRAPSVSPMFQQLETLVEHWKFSEASEYLSPSESVEKVEHSKPKPNDPMQQLSSLTGDLMQGSQKSQSAQPAPKNRKAAEVVGIGARQNANATKPMVTPDSVNKNINADMSESHPRAQALSVKNLAANGLHVQAFKQVQESMQKGSALNDLSPIATQKVADALNDYLQEQAELHGVDL